MDDRYTVEIFWSSEDQAYVATVEELRGCSAFGDSREDALREVQTAMELWLDVARKHGDPIPAPNPKAVEA